MPVILTAVANPAKYFNGIAHGVLFILFIFAVIQVTIVHRKSILWALGAFVSSVIPFGTFVLDAKLKNEQQ
ncbi:DUF3817 domain-containing protein [Bacillus sp. B-TM1]